MCTVPGGTGLGSFLAAFSFQKMQEFLRILKQQFEENFISYIFIVCWAVDETKC